MLQAPLVATIALMLEAAVGYPDRLYRWAGHPVSWIGALIARVDRDLNREDDLPARRRRLGVLALLIVAGLPTGVAFLLQAAATRCLAAAGPLSAITLLGVLAAMLPAQRSLHVHVAAVAAALERNGSEAGRAAVAMIVGRDTASLDEAGIARAAIESLAENFSDGVVAPLLWCAVFGLPGAVFYKAVNTADSMIGHRTARHEAFGWASARLDDLVNLPASRLSALWIMLAAPRRIGAALRTVARDAGSHRSPNAGWPEGAMAAVLDVRLAGPRVYGGIMVEDHWMGNGRAVSGASDVRYALSIYRRACLIQAVILSAIALWAWTLR